nr:MAG TPA: hypothetical protein [Caudoviricetes sp.]
MISKSAQNEAPENESAKTVIGSFQNVRLFLMLTLCKIFHWMSTKM